MNKVFLSHPHSAAKTAVSFARWLEKVFGGRIIVICTSEPEHHIDPGHMVTTGIIEHIKSSSVVLVLVTPESLKLPWIFYEMGAAHALGKVFIPCVARGLYLRDLPPQAYEYQGAELGSEAGLRRLLDALSHYLDAPPVALADCNAVAQSFA
jgi:hypothetical protein